MIRLVFQYSIYITGIEKSMSFNKRENTKKSQRDIWKITFSFIYLMTLYI